MPRSKPVHIGSTIFPSKKAAKECYRAIRDRYPDGVEIRGLDHSLLLELVEIHPEAAQKFGVGIDHFTVEVDQEFGTTRHFVIHRSDGTSTDVSFNSAIDGRNRNADRLEALRRAIAPQITRFAQAKLDTIEPLACPFTEEQITIDNYHVDHEAPATFQKLSTDWLAMEGIGLEAVEITPPADNQYVCEMTNQNQRISWETYHTEYARLRLLSKAGNLSGARVRPVDTQ